MFDEYIGIDLHRAFFQVCSVTPEGTRQWEARFENDRPGVTAFLARCHGRSAVAIEASGATWPFMDQVYPQLARVQVIDARKTRLRAGVAAKTDRLDARRLADALRRDSVVPVYYPSPTVRDLRELCRYRGVLVRLRVTLKQRIHAVLIRQGVTPPPVSDLFGRAGRRWLQTAPLTGWAQVACTGYQAHLRAVTTTITRLETAMQGVAATDPIVQALDTIPGVGVILALMLRAEIGDIRRFAHPAQVASYAGLVPRVIQSGQYRRTGRITRQGAPWLRWALVEAAVHASRRRDALGAWTRRLAVAKGAGKARIAAARRLAEDVHVVWTQALSPSAVGDSLPADGVL
jgi:transposase